MFRSYALILLELKGCLALESTSEVAPTPIQIVHQASLRRRRELIAQQRAMS